MAQISEGKASAGVITDWRRKMKNSGQRAGTGCITQPVDLRSLPVTGILCVDAVQRRCRQSPESRL